MKKTLITLALVACTVSAYAQGQINFSTRISGTLVIPIYMPQVGDPFAELHGQSAIGIPAGATAYTGGVIPATSGARFTAQLFGGPLGTADDALSPLTPTANFRTQTALAGYVVSPGSVIVQGVPGGSQARIQLRVWDNQGGTVTSWADAFARASAGNQLIGSSLAFDSLALTVAPATPPDLVGLTSFNLHFVPEPSVIALGVLGVGALVLFRRRRN